VSQAIPADSEMIKIKGKSQSWCCYYFDNKDNCCTIYAKRPYACRVLKCWQPEASLELIARKDTLSRLDILTEKPHLTSLVEEYEAQCPAPDLEKLLLEIKDNNQQIPDWFVALVEQDLRFRQQVIKKENLSLAMELFLFARPIMQIIKPLGIVSRIERGRLVLRMQGGGNLPTAPQENLS
jgi:Fe-S-cluster containining protein